MNRPRKHHGERLTLNPFGGMAHALTLGSALGRLRIRIAKYVKPRPTGAAV